MSTTHPHHTMRLAAAVMAAGALAAAAPASASTADRFVPTRATSNLSRGTLDIEAATTGRRMRTGLRLHVTARTAGRVVATVTPCRRSRGRLRCVRSRSRRTHRLDLRAGRNLVSRTLTVAIPRRRVICVRVKLAEVRRGDDAQLLGRRGRRHADVCTS